MRQIGNTRARAITESLELVRSVGFNSLAVQKVADALGIRKPSLFQHFDSKEDLGVCMIEDYQARFQEWAKTVSVFDPAAQIGALFEVFCELSADSQKICPLFALMGDYHSFPKPLKKAVDRLSKARHEWTAAIVKQGQARKMFRRDKSAGELADLLHSIAMGGQFTARVTGKPELVRNLKAQALEILRVR